MVETASSITQKKVVAVAVLRLKTSSIHQRLFTARRNVRPTTLRPLNVLVYQKQRFFARVFLKAILTKIRKYFLPLVLQTFMTHDRIPQQKKGLMSYLIYMIYRRHNTH